MTDWLTILAAAGAAYCAIRWTLRASDRAADRLAATLTRVPTHTVRQTVCAWCSRVLHEERWPYDEKAGAREVSHGICRECLDVHFPAVDCEWDDATAVVAERLRRIA